MKTLTNLFILLLFAINTIAQPIQLDDEFWYNRGPECVHGRAIAMAESDSNVLYLGTFADGLYKSENGGQSWFRCDTTNVPRHDTSFITSPSFSSWMYGCFKPVDVITVDPDNSSHVFVGFQEAGMIVSEDGGLSWNRTNDYWPDTLSINYININPINSDHVVIGAGRNNAAPSGTWPGGIYYSLDGGNSWNLTQGVPSDSTIVESLKRNPSNPNHLLASVTSFNQPGYRYALYESTNGGQNWSVIADELKIFDIVFDPTNNQKLWSIVSTTYMDKWLHYSNDGGHTWVLYEGFDESYIPWVYSLFMDFDGNLIIERGISDETFSRGIFMSTDGGNSWLPIDKLDSLVPGVDNRATSLKNSCVGNHADNEIFICNRYGIYHSENGGTNTEHINKGITNSYLYSIATSPFDSDVAYTAGAQGVWKTTDGGLSWDRLFNYYVGEPTIDQKNPSIIYFSSYTLSRSIDGGETFTTLYDFPGLIDDVKIHPELSDVLFVHSSPNPYAHFLYKSEDYGETWQVKLSSEAKEGDFGIQICDYHPDTVYFSTYRSFDRGSTWEDFFDKHIVGIHPLHPNILYATNLDKDELYKSTDNGHTFELIYQSNYTINNFTIAKNSPDYLFYSTELNGIKYSDDGGVNWYSLEGSYNQRVRGFIPIIQENKYYIATMGYGVSGYNTDTLNSINPPGNSLISGIEAYPNPFQNRVLFNIFLRESSDVEIIVFNIKGQQVLKMKKRRMYCGRNIIEWNGKDNLGLDLDSGFYFISFITNHDHRTLKLFKSE